jgi:hypothetical protein
MRSVPAIAMCVSYKDHMTLHKEPKFLHAAWITGMSFTRFKPGAWVGIFYPVRPLSFLLGVYVLGHFYLGLGQVFSTQ